MIKRSIIPIILIFLTLCFTACEKESEDPDENIKELLLLEINHLRQSGCNCGSEYMPPVPAYGWNSNLENAALLHAKDMSIHGFFSHFGSDSSIVFQRAERAGYQGYAVGENIARGYNTVKSVMNGWKGSESHCRALMDSSFQEIGAAKYNDYWVLDFGRNKPF